MTASEAPTIGLTHGGSEDTGLGHRGPESKSIVVPYGFWLFVLSDMVLFSALFATYATLVHATDGGPTTNQLFDRSLVAIETIALLLSSFTCGLAMIAAKRGNMVWTQGWLLVTGLLGVVFLFDRALRVRARWSPKERRRSAAPSCRPSSPSSAATARTSPPACCGSAR